jgi:DNA-binding transcriptional ArsR family regulator
LIQKRNVGRRREGELNRSRIVNELLKSPLTFGKLKAKVELSNKTLTKHLNDLKDESLVKREIQGKYIVYKIATPQTILEMRKALHEELNRLLWVYWNCLNKDTGRLFNQATDSLKKSIDEPEPMDNLTVFGKTYRIPAHKKTEEVRIKQDEDKYKKPEIEIESKFKSRKGRRKK